MPRGKTFGTYADPYALAEAIARLCEDPHPEGDDWRTRCPNHQGKGNTSLSITPGDDKVLLHCFAGCRTADIVHALGLTMADLYVKTTKDQSTLGRIVAIYDYYDAQGALLHQTVRYDPKQFRQRRPDPSNPGRYIWDLKTIDLVLYHLPEVHQAIQQHKPIFVVEGEKDADLLLKEGLIATCNPMGAGKGKWRPSYTKVLHGADVIILADYDNPGWEHAHTIAARLLGSAATIKVVYTFHTHEPGSDISDWIAAGGTREEFDAIVESTPLYNETSADDAGQGAPFGWPLDKEKAPEKTSEHTTETASKNPEPLTGRTIEQYRHLLPQVVAQAQEALLAMPGAPLVFQRARRLVAVAPAEKTAKGIARTHGTPIISALTGPRLRALLAHAAVWQSPNATQTKVRPDMPQQWLVETLLDQEEWPFPPLTGIVNSPTMRPDGSLILTQGYDADTGLWLAWNQETFPAVPPHPTKQDAQTALRMLAEPFHDFPFAADYHRSAVIAAVLTLIARYAVESVPLFAIRATTRGSGKTLLADCIAMIATGRAAPKMPQVKEVEEERKRLLALALDGDPLVVIDNVVGALGNPALDLAVTSQLFKDRLLGQNAMKEAPLYAVFLATGNNMFFKGDMARRAIPIDLAPLVEHPETRYGFVHPRLLDWIQGERPRLISAALTLLRAYWIAGKPGQPLDPYGSFERWSDLIRSALVWVGAPDPCAGREGLEAASDEMFEAHTELLEAWHTCYRHGPMTLTQIVGDLQFRCTPVNSSPEKRTQEMEQWDCLRDALGFFDQRFDGQRLNSKSLGKSLKRLCGRIINGKRLKQLAERSKYGTQWAIEEVSQKGVFGVDSVYQYPPYAQTLNENSSREENSNETYGELWEPNALHAPNTPNILPAEEDDLSDIPF